MKKSNFKKRDSENRFDWRCDKHIPAFAKHAK